MESLLGLVAAIWAGMEALGIAPRIRAYFSPARRSQRALLVAALAKDVLGLAVLQKGVTPAQAAAMDDVIGWMIQRLVAEGTKVNSQIARDKARGQASRALAGAALNATLSPPVS